MAEIYRAKTFDSHGFAHLVAVKRVLDHLAEDTDFVAMLTDEARIAALVSHPKIARIYEFSRSQGEYFIAMEYVDGKDVRSLLERCRARGRPLPPAHATWIASEVADALHAAHCATDPDGAPLHLVHRDVSPANVLCAYSGEVKLCDFGIAKATLSAVETKAGVIKGKVKYMSPEQALGRKLDHRSDLFSLGTVLYEMLSLSPPFVAQNEMDLLFKVRDARYRPLPAILADLPPGLVAIVDRALSRSRESRYQSGDELAVELRAFLFDHQPAYTKNHLGRYLRKMFEEDIERELRLLEGYVLGTPEPEDVGENLIGGAQGQDPPFSRAPPRRVVTPKPAASRRASVFKGSPDGRDPKELDPAIHDAPTLILPGRKPR
jgi:serine/threonine-protein kinase